MTDGDLAELVEIRRDLREMRFYVENPDLRAKISAWVEESHEKDDADTAREFVESRLTKLLANYPMYHAPTLARGADGFPDECKGCRHYGSACQVLRNGVQERWRERKLDEAQNEHQARKVYQEQAIDVGCHRIPEFLEEYDSRFAEFVQEGQRLVDRVEDHVHELSADTDDDHAAAEAEAVADGGGSVE